MLSMGVAQLLRRRGDALPTSGFMVDVISARTPRLLDVAAQLTRGLGLGYKRGVGIPVAGNGRTGLLLAVGLGGSTGGRSLRNMTALLVSASACPRY